MSPSAFHSAPINPPIKANVASGFSRVILSRLGYLCNISLLRNLLHQVAWFQKKHLQELGLNA